MNLHALFAIAVQRTPDKVALQFAAENCAVTSAHTSPDGKWATLSYRELYAAADRLAGGLQRWGLQKVTAFLPFSGNRPEFVIAYLAVIKLGAIMVPVNLRYRRTEIGHIFADCAPLLGSYGKCRSAIFAGCGLSDER